MEAKVEILDDQRVTQLTSLSPDVERHRKGRRPRKGRCPSYWDTDILRSDARSSSTSNRHGGNKNKHGDESEEEDAVDDGNGEFTQDGRKIVRESEHNREAAQPEKFCEAEEAAFLFSAAW